MKDSIIVLSGGVDSVTLLYEYASHITLAITFDYGSNHATKEIACAKYHCQKLNIPHKVIPMNFIKEDFRSALLNGADAIPTGDYAPENMHETVVPFRNGIMLSIAAGYAESYGIQKVMIANHSGDHAIYPDCTPGFVGAMDQAITAGTYNNVHLVAPYTLYSKEEIVAIGKRLGIDYDQTWSCYKGEEKPCGVCSTCIERDKAMKANNLL